MTGWELENTINVRNMQRDGIFKIGIKMVFM